MKYLIYLLLLGLPYCGGMVETTSPSPQSSCPSGWLIYAGENVCIFPIRTPQYFRDTARDCALKGGSMVKIQNAFENGYFSILISEINGQTPFIGVEKLTNGSWAYQDGSRLTYANWDQGEPNTLGATMDCAIIDPYSLKWKASECSMPRPSFCQVNSNVGSSLPPAISTIFPVTTLTNPTPRPSTSSRYPFSTTSTIPCDPYNCNYQGICNGVYPYSCSCYGNLDAKSMCATSVCTPIGQSLVQDLSYWSDGSYIVSPGWNYKLSEHGQGYASDIVCEWQMKTIDGKLIQLSTKSKDPPFQNMAPMSKLTINNGNFAYQMDSTTSLAKVNAAFQQCTESVTRLTFSAGTLNQERPFWFDVNLLMV